jgi:hypothetical protein
MELLLLLLIVPIAWLVLLPSRIAGAARRYRFAGVGVLLVLLIGGWFAIQALAVAPESRADYAAGDSALRALLE